MPAKGSPVAKTSTPVKKATAVKKPTVCSLVVPWAVGSGDGKDLSVSLLQSFVGPRISGRGLEGWIDSANLLNTVAFMTAGEESRRQVAGDPGNHGQEVVFVVSLETLDARPRKGLVDAAAGEQQRIQTSASVGVLWRRGDGRSGLHPHPSRMLWTQAGLLAESQGLIVRRDLTHALAGALVDDGADLERKDESGRTALHVAVGGGDVGMAMLLLDAGANVAAKMDDGACQALHLAAQQGDEEMVSVLLGAGADVLARELEGDPFIGGFPPGSTALHFAARANHMTGKEDFPGATKVLVEAG